MARVEIHIDREPILVKATGGEPTKGELVWGFEFWEGEKLIAVIPAGVGVEFFVTGKMKSVVEDRLKKLPCQKGAE